MNDRFFVTGATGCIGGWVVRNLVESGCDVYALVRGGNLDRLKLIMTMDELAKVRVIQGDINDAQLLQECVAKHGIERIIHLAAMQLPFCQADPRLGARVNVEGTVNVFEAAKKCGIRSLVYSSSTAVYGRKDQYPEGPLAHDARLLPHSLYGVYKQANEWTARVYYEMDGVSSIGIRPYVVYGPLRDQGMTSTPTFAMKAAVRLEKYEISYGGRFNFQYVDDTAKAFIRAAYTDYEGADAFNLGGGAIDMSDVVEAIELVEPRAKGLITYADKPLPFPSSVRNEELEKIIGPVCTTTLVDGVRKSVEIFSGAKEVYGKR
jgi:nucleoside-diphosphate-sugar epimerase